MNCVHKLRKFKRESNYLTLIDVSCIKLSESNISWISPNFPRRLLNNEVHIWRLNLKQLDLHALSFASILSDREKMRAGSFHFKKNKKRFIIGRGILRIILGFYLDIKPELLEFLYGPYGKPQLNEKNYNETIQFNLTHSHELALCAFTRGRRLGIDLEYITNIPDLKVITTHIFSRRENKKFKKIPKNKKLNAFLKCWTVKEAYSKAIGTGLTELYKQFNLSFSLKISTSKRKIKIYIKKTSNWSLMSFAPLPDYTASLVVEGQDWYLSQFQFKLEK